MGLTTGTWKLSENLEGFSQILQEQWGETRYLGVYTPNSNNLKIWKPTYCIENFAIEYLRKTKKFAKPFVPVRWGPIVEYLKQKNYGKKSCDTVSLCSPVLRNWSRLEPEVIHVRWAGWFLCLRSRDSSEGRDSDAPVQPKHCHIVILMNKSA